MVEETKQETMVKEIEESVKNGGGKKKQKVDNEVTVTLPSKGLIYHGEVPSEITLRGMTTKEEKILYASQGKDVFKKILKNCIISPKDIDINKLIAADESFLIMQLRLVTYGDIYRVSVVCPSCGKREDYQINLSDFEVNYLSEDFTEPIEVELPRSGDTVSIRLLRNEDVEFINRYARRRAKDFNLNYKEVQYTCRIAKHIQKINDEELDFVETLDYVENMLSMDSAKIRTVLTGIRVGLDTTATVTCRNCGEDFDFIMPLTSEFFRPTIE